MSLKKGDSSYARRAGAISIPTIKKLNECVRNCRDDFNDRIGEYSGVYFEEGDESDVLTSKIQKEIFNIRGRCDKHLENRGIARKLVENIPLPLFFPSMKRKVFLLIRLDKIERKLGVTTSHRRQYRDVCFYAFNPEKTFDDLRNGELDLSKWCPNFQLLETKSSKDTWTTLGYTQEGFMAWWAGRRARSKPGVSDSSADLKAFCKSVVFVSDVICSERVAHLSCASELRHLAKQCQDIAFKLVRQMSLHPQYASGVSTLFGISTPLVFALSRLAEKAQGLTEDAEPVRIIKIEHVFRGISELEPLIGVAVTLIEEFSANLRYQPYEPVTKEDRDRLSYVPKPSVAQLFDACPCELTGDAEATLLETGLVSDKASLTSTMDRIQRQENSTVVQKMGQKPFAGSNGDAMVLEQLGLTLISVVDVPEGMLGHGSTAIVCLHSSRCDPSRKYAVKHIRPELNGRVWNNLKREASIWNTLQHENILPLLGYCTLRPQDSPDSSASSFPGLVAPLCAGGSMTEYLREHVLTYRKKTEFLRDIASGLAYLHSKKVCHGDLRAANILVDESSGEARAMICDFGLSDFFTEATERLYRPSEDQKTEDRWLAPELMFTDPGTVARISAKGDMYAFGCVILEVIFGKEPYDSYPPHHEVLAKREGVLPASRSDMDDTYWPISEKCWRYLPEERPTAEWVFSYLANHLRYSTALS